MCIFSLCPKCGSSDFRLADPTGDRGLRDYLLCLSCSCIWTVSTRGPDFDPTFVSLKPTDSVGDGPIAGGRGSARDPEHRQRAPG